ncbi:MAG: C-GCAxxG-C-C family protein [Humidesulfovibrio sp.]|nr:C-GCAxxG-C-C family protein [Humidesulfovibrio sp.]
MNRAQVEQAALEAISSGRNCAESVLHTAGLHLGVNEDGRLTRTASCFGGGVGRSKQELCGALAGGLMALGLACGRDTPGQSCEKAYDLGAEFREQFMAMHGASACRDLLERFGPQKDWECCKRLTASAAGLLFDIAHGTGEAG